MVCIVFITIYLWLSQVWGNSNTLTGVLLDQPWAQSMDEQALSELLECSVCLERLDHTSKVLPCQHTFCRRCLEEILSTQQELRCPECRTLVTVRVEDLPPNILLVRLLEGLKTQGHVLSSKPSSYHRRRDTSADSRQQAARPGLDVSYNDSSVYSQFCVGWSCCCCFAIIS